jgi:hypothetical protein
MPIPLIIAAVAFGIGGIAYGCDQHSKRANEQSEFRSYRRKTEKKVSDLETRLNEKNRQVRVLSEELKRQRRKSA